MAISQCRRCGTEISYDFEITIPSSPALELLQSGVVPDPSTALLIKDLLVNARVTLCSVNHEIEKISKFLSYLREKSEALEDTISQHAQSLTPIRRIPDDILSEIFSLVLHPYSEINARSGPLLFSRVCRAWRQCAQTSQRIWASFGVSSNQAPTSTIVRSWLSHARSIPLSPHIHLEVTPSDARRAWPAIAEVIAYCDRWQNLVITSPISVLRSFNSVQGRLPSLEYLSIKLHANESHHQCIEAFVLAPRLRRLHQQITGVLSQIRLPWGQLTHLELDIECDYDRLRFMEESLLSTFQELVGLIDLSLTCNCECRERRDIPLIPVTLHHLQYLKIVLPDLMGDIFEMIRCPALKSISIEQADIYWTYRPFLSFLGTLSSLESITICLMSLGDPDEPPDLIPTLRAVPTVKYLWINSMDADIPDRLLHSMTCPANGPYLLPALRELDIDATMSDLLFIDVVKSRINGNGRLAQLKRVWYRSTRDDEIAWISTLPRGIVRPK